MNRSLRPQSPRARGLTLIELLVVLVVLVAIVVVFWPAGPRYGSARQLKDSAQIRTLHQGLILWAKDNKDRYPMPSLLDAANLTVAAEIPESKDTMANTLSILIYNGFFPPDLLVTMAEPNPNIKIFDQYQYQKPEAAADADKSKALWDPAFSVDFTNGKTGHTSYAMMIRVGARAKQWANTSEAGVAVLGNRGPQIKSLKKGGAPNVTATLENPVSNTLLIHGGRKTWEGNISYNDNHVDFETSLAPETTFYRDAKGLRWNDCLFADEIDDAAGTNNYLGIWTTAGKEMKDFSLMWD